MKGKSKEEEEKEIIENAILHGECTLNGNFKQGNKAFKKLEGIKTKIYNEDEKYYVGLLLKLLSQPNYFVRKFAAANLLPFEPEIAKGVLEEISKNSNLVGFTAEMTLREFEKGRLKIKPQTKK